MLTLPTSFKYLLRKDNVRKNFRVHFPNGEREDITNDNVVFETVKFTESLCSRNTLKFGLAEASTLRFTTVGVENIKGCTIEAQIEVDATYLSNTKPVVVADTDLEFVTLINDVATVYDDLEFVSYDTGSQEVITDACMVANLLVIYNVPEGFETCYFSPQLGWVLKTIRSEDLEEMFPGIDEDYAFIYDEATGSLGRARNRGLYWEVTGVTNLLNPSSPNYAIYSQGMTEEFDIQESDDVPFPFVVVPLGVFRVDQCERQNDMKKRNIIAMTDVKKHFSLPTYELSKIKTARTNEIVYEPNFVGLLQYYGIYQEYVHNSSPDILTKDDVDHQSLDTTHETTPFILDQSWYLGYAVDGSPVSISTGAGFPADTMNYIYTVAGSYKAESRDDVFYHSTAYKITTINEKELIRNTFDTSDREFLINLGTEALVEINRATQEAATRDGASADSFLLMNDEENLIRIAKALISLAYAVYRHLRKVNGYKTVTTAKVYGSDRDGEEEVYQFSGDLPSLFNNQGHDKYAVYPFFPATAANDSIVYNRIEIPVLFLIRLSGAFGFALESIQGDFEDVEFVTIVDGQEEAFPFVFVAFTDYQHIPFEIEDHVFYSAMTLSRYNLEYTPTMYHNFPDVIIRHCDTIDKKTVDFSTAKIEVDDEGYYKVNTFDPKEHITAYMESRGWFCIFDRAMGCYRERSLQASYHSLYPAETLYPSNDLYPEETEIQLYMSTYRSLWYAESLVGPVGGIKYDYKSEAEVEDQTLTMPDSATVNGNTVTYNDGDLSGENLAFDEQGDRIVAYYPEYKDVYYYDLTGNKRFEDITKDEAEKVVERLFNEIEDVYYMPSDVKAVGVPYIEAGDYVAITTQDDHIETVVLRRTMSGIHFLQDQLESK